MADDDFEPQKSCINLTKNKARIDIQTYMLFEDNYDVNLALAATSKKTVQSSCCPVLAPSDAVEYIRLRSIEVITKWT